MPTPPRALVHHTLSRPERFMAAGGAVVAIIAAENARRMQEVTDAFRVAGATAPERARSLEELNLAHAASGAEALARDGVLLPGRGRGTWYLSEAAVVARRRARERVPRLAVVLLAVLLIAIGAVVLGVVMAGPRT